MAVCQRQQDLASNGTQRFIVALVTTSITVYRQPTIVDTTTSRSTHSTFPLYRNTHSRSTITNTNPKISINSTKPKQNLQTSTLIAHQWTPPPSLPTPTRIKRATRTALPVRAKRGPEQLDRVHFAGSVLDRVRFREFVSAEMRAMTFILRGPIRF
ncbi:hypothetical protein AKJ16_DCAP08011 [Drosera capensis]